LQQTIDYKSYTPFIMQHTYVWLSAVLPPISSEQYRSYCAVIKLTGGPHTAMFTVSTKVHETHSRTSYYAYAFSYAYAISYTFTFCFLDVLV